MNVLDKEYCSHRVLILSDIAINKEKRNSILKENTRDTKCILLERHLDIPRNITFSDLHNLIQDRTLVTVKPGDNIVVNGENDRELLMDTFNIVRQEEDREAIHIYNKEDMRFTLFKYLVYEYDNLLIFIDSTVHYKSILEFIYKKYSHKLESTLECISKRELDIITNAKLVYFGEVLEQKQSTNYNIIHTILGTVKGICYFEKALKISFSMKENLDLTKLKDIYSLLHSSDKKSVTHGLSSLLNYNLCNYPYTILQLIKSLQTKGKLLLLEKEKLLALNRIESALSVLLQSKINHDIEEDDKHMLEYVIQENQKEEIRLFILKYIKKKSDVEIKITIH